MEGKDIRPAKTRAAIRQALIRLLRHRTLGEITVSALCKEAQISRSAFYCHYRNTQECFRDILSGLAADIQRQYDSDRVYSREEFMRILFCYIRTQQERMVVIRSLPINSSIMEHTIDFYNKCTGKSVKTRSVSEKMWIKYRLVGCLGLVDEWLKDDCRSPEEDLIEAMFALK